MKVIGILVAIIGIVHTRPQSSYRDAYITRYDYENSGIEGRYSFDVETSDGFKHSARGGLVSVPEEPEPFQAVVGEYSYIGDDGVLYRVEYVADQEGFHPAGAHLHGADTDKVKPKKLGIPSAALASLSGGGLG